MTLATGVKALAEAVAVDVKALEDGKVDKVAGKGLSESDYTAAEKTKLAGIKVGATKNRADSANADKAHNHTTAQVSGLDTALESKASKTELSDGLALKVDKVAGKELSDTNFTQAEKNKLSSLESSKFVGLFVSDSALPTTGSAGDYANVDGGVGSDVYRVIWDTSDKKWVRVQGVSVELTDAQIKQQYEANPDTNAFTDAQKTKLTSIETGATKNATDALLRARSSHTGTQPITTITGLQDRLNSKANTSTKVIAGTGLSGGGALSADRTLSVDYGTTAGTAAQGNDSRIINGQTAFGWGNHASVGYLTSVSWSQVSSKPTTATRWPTFAEVTGKPIVQTTGASTTDIMSQKAVTDALAATAPVATAPVVVAASATVTLTNGRAVYAVNTTSAARTLTLPADPPAGATVTIIDYANTCGINKLTIARNGRNIEGAAANAALTQNGQRVEMAYIDATQGWKVISSYRHGGFI